MKIRIDYTLDVDPKVMRLLADNDEPIRDFVRSHVIYSGVSVMSEALYNAGLPDAVEVIKINF